MLNTLLTDLRFIIGLFFTFCGSVLILTSFLGESDLVEGFRINLDSGAMMLGFGIFMLALAWFKRGESNDQ